MNYINDINITAQVVGIFAWAEVVGKFSLADFCARFPQVSFGLVSEYFSEVDDDVFMLSWLKEKGPNGPAEEAVEAARLAYPGRKPSFPVLLALLKKKHKDWKSEAKKFLPAIEREAAHKARLKAHDSFCPDWRNMQTWINNRAWEEEFGDKRKQPSEVAVMENNVFQNYRIAVCQAIESKDTENKMLDWTQLRLWIECEGPFKGAKEKVSAMNRKQIFWDAHSFAWANKSGAKGIWEELNRRYNDAK